MDEVYAKWDTLTSMHMNQSSDRLCSPPNPTIVCFSRLNMKDVTILYSSLNNEKPIFNCCKCPGQVDCQTFKCSQCLTDDQEVANFYQDNMQESFESTMERVLNDKSDDTKQDLASLLSYLDLLTRKAKLPTIHVNNCQEIVKLCFSLKANFARL